MHDCLPGDASVAARLRGEAAELVELEPVQSMGIVYRPLLARLPDGRLVLVLERCLPRTASQTPSA